MFRRLLVATLGLLAVSAVLASADTLEQVLERHFAAVGGRERLMAIQSMRTTGRMTMGPGMEAPVDGAPCWKLKLTKQNGDVDYQYLDAETYLLVREEGKRTRRGEVVEGESTVGNYKDVDGLLLPFTMTNGTKGSPMKQQLTIDRIEIDPKLDDARFAMRSAASDSAKIIEKPAAASPDKTPAMKAEKPAKAKQH